MIITCFSVQQSGEMVACSVQGHSELAKAGQDILCAAVSSAVYLTANTITEVIGVTPEELRAEEGDFYLKLAPKDAPPCRTILAGLRLHLESLAEQYPEGLRVCQLELPQ